MSVKDNNSGALKKPSANSAKNSGFGVAASPFNAVKLELGVIMCLGAMIWFLVPFFIEDDFIQLLLLFTFSVGCMLRLIMRTRSILKQITTSSSDDVPSKYVN